MFFACFKVSGQPVTHIDIDYYPIGEIEKTVSTTCWSEGGAFYSEKRVMELEEGKKYIIIIKDIVLHNTYNNINRSKIYIKWKDKSYNLTHEKKFEFDVKRFDYKDREFSIFCKTDGNDVIIGKLPFHIVAPYKHILGQRSSDLTEYINELIIKSQNKRIVYTVNSGNNVIKLDYKKHSLIIEAHHEIEMPINTCFLLKPLVDNKYEIVPTGRPLENNFFLKDIITLRNTRNGFSNKVSILVKSNKKFESPNVLKIQPPVEYRPPINGEHYTGEFTDKRDGQSYRWVKLKDGNKWMSQNINYKTANSWIYNDFFGNAKNHGRLYTWYEAQEVCPDGWRLPTKYEWIKMAEYYGGSMTDNSDSNGQRAYRDLIMGGSSGFEICLAGVRTSEDKYVAKSNYGGYWTSSEGGSNILFRDDLKRLEIQKYSDSYYGFSCRCIKEK